MSQIRPFFILASICAFMVSLSSLVLAQNFVIKVKNGKIDWTNGVVEAYCTGVPPRDVSSVAQARAIAKKMAVETAKKELREIIDNIAIDSKLKIGDLLRSHPDIEEKVKEYINQSETVDVVFLKDQRVKVTVAFNIYGDFSQIILPPIIKNIEPIKQSRPRGKNKKQKITGIVVDCRGLGVRPSLIPRILNENGSEVYGPKYVSREHVVSGGMVCFTKDIKLPLIRKRIGTNPMLLKGIRTCKSSPTEIIISNSQGEDVHRDAENLRLLQECRVVFIMD